MSKSDNPGEEGNWNSMATRRSRFVIRAGVAVLALAVLAFAAYERATIIDVFLPRPIYGNLIGGPQPVAAPGTNYTFAYCGDEHENAAVMTEIIREARAAGCAFGVHNGDMVHRYRDASFDAFYRTVWQAAGGEFPVYLAVGNHDTRGTIRTIDGVNFHRFLGPTHYVFWYGSDAFVVVDSTTTSFGPDEQAWFDKTLAAVRPAARNVFVLSHIPPADPRPNRSTALQPEAGRRFLEIAKKHNVTRILSSHIHAYFDTQADGIPLTISGGAGGRFFRDASFHWTLVTVDGTTAKTEERRLPAEIGGQGTGPTTEEERD